MLPDEKISRNESNQHNRFDDPLAFLEIVPFAVALWSRDRSLFLLNEPAKRLIRFSEPDILNHHSLWVDQIYSADKKRFSAFQKELDKGKSPVSCDYRILPIDADRPIWIREVSVFTKDQRFAPWNIISAYTEISGLKANDFTDNREGEGADVTKLLIHDVKNCVQKVTMALQLAQLSQKEKLDSTKLLSAVESVNRSLQDLRNCFDPVPGSFTSQDPVVLLNGILRNMRKELNRQRVNLRLVRREPVPMIWGNTEDLRSAFERVFEFCGAILKKGGDLQVEAGPKQIDGQNYAEVRVRSSSPVSIEIDEAEAFQPYLKVDNDRIGLGMALAAEIIRRYQGQVSFRKENKNRGQVTILMKASPN